VETVADPLEAGAVGIALTAAVGLGIYPDFEALKKIVPVGREFEPQASNAECYNDLYRLTNDSIVPCEACIER